MALHVQEVKKGVETNYMKSEFAVIGGSQAYDLLRTGDVSGERLGPVDTPFGQSQPIYRLSDEFDNAFFLSRHGEKGYSLTAPFVNYRANIYALKDKGVKRIISWSGPGTINTDFKIGQYVIADDIIDETKTRKSTFFENKGIGFIRQNPVFCPTLRGLVKDSLSSLSTTFADKGTYVCTEGPRLETPAEIKKFSVIGGDLVGMTLSPRYFWQKSLRCVMPRYAILQTMPKASWKGLLSRVNYLKDWLVMMIDDRYITRLCVSLLF